MREAIGYGQISPQTVADLRGEYAQMIMWDRHVGPGGMGEDCLNLNVWTPGVDDAKRAVMVSFHGGGWHTGSGNGPMYDGANLARFGDVVVVTVNHRLAAFGYLHLAGLAGMPGELADAGAVGRRRHGRLAAMGARQHRRLRRRSGPGDDLRPVRRRLQGLDTAGDALGQGPVPPRRDPVRLDPPPADAGAGRQVGRRCWSRRSAATRIADLLTAPWTAAAAGPDRRRAPRAPTSRR